MNSRTTTTPRTFLDPMSACDEADRRGPGHYVTGGYPRNVPGWLITNDRGEILHDDNTFRPMGMGGTCSL